MDQLYTLLTRATANSIKEVKGSKHDVEDRRKLLNTQYAAMKRSYGPCYMVKFGDDDIRPMWENQISISNLKQEIKPPWGEHYDCPLCQPYDDPELRERRNMCKVVIPKYSGGAIDEEGVLMKCPCILDKRNRVKKELKFKP